jgi:zinc transporter, ZIP family
MPDAWYALFPGILLAVSAGVAGGVLPVLRTPSERLTAVLQHFAAGVLLSIICFGISVEIDEMGLPLIALVGIVFGAVVIVSMKLFLRRYETPGDDPSPAGFIGAAFLDTLVDGFLIGAAATIQPGLAVFLMVGLGIELFVLTSLVSSELLKLRWKKLLVVAMAVGIAATQFVGATLGTIVMVSQGDTTQTVALGVALAVLLYLVAEELLLRGNEVENSSLTTSALFVGFIGLTAYTLLAPV